MKQEKILISFNKNAAESEIQQIERSQAKQSEIYKLLSEIIGEPVTIEEFMSILRIGNTNAKLLDFKIRELFISKKAPDGMINGIPVNTDIIKAPDTSAIKNIRWSSNEVDMIHREYLSIVDGEIVKAKGYSLRVSENHKVYAETPEEIERYKLASKLAEAMNDIAKTLSNPNNLLSNSLKAVVSLDNGVFHPSSFYIKRGKVSWQ